MGEGDVALQLEQLQQQLQGFWNENVSSSPALPDETMEELSTAVEELHASSEELRHAGESIARERRRYQELFDLAPDPYIVTDVDAVVVEANRAAHQVLGRSGPLIGKPLAAFLVDREGLHRRITPLRSGNDGPVSWITHVRRRGFAPLPVSVRVTASKDDSGRTTGFRWIMHDIEERVRGEERERASQQLVTAQLRDNNQRLAELERRKTEFLRIASHELGSPIAIVRGYLSMILAGDFGELPPGVERAAQTALERCRVVVELIDRMLDTARAEDHAFPMTTERIDLRHVLQRAIDSAVSWRRDRDRVMVTCPDHAVLVRGDAEQLVKALAAMVENGLKYSRSHKRVLCDLNVDDAAAVATVSVRDEGIGLSADARNRLFQPFGRVVTNETSHIFGSGLGLYLAREIARLHRGDVRLVATEEGRGSAFELQLPLAPSAGLP